MSAISRVVSGSAASWSRLCISVVAQIFLVPVFLSHWDPATYGLWIGILALATLIQFIDFGHHNYIGYEALKFGADSRNDIARLYKSAVRVALCLSAIELLVLAVFVVCGYHVFVLGIAGLSSDHLRLEAGVILLLYSLSWLIFGNWSSVAGRVLVPFGYYPQIAWWQVGGAIVGALAPAIAVSFGADLLEAGIAYQIAYAAYAVPTVLYVRRMTARERLDAGDIDYSYGIANFVRSLVLSFKSVSEMARQEQFRIVVAPLVGAANLVLFVTTRTVANVLVAALATVTGPILPELMRYLNRRDREKCVASITILWIILVAILAPAAVIAQLFIAPLFEIWTRGKISFDHTLFALFSTSVLLFALAQPAMFVLQGLNILRPQVAISLGATLIALTGTFLFAPLVGVKGAAIALLAGEVFATVCAFFLLRRIFTTMSMAWPKRQALITVSAILLSFVLIGIASQTEGNEKLILFAAVGCAVVAFFLLVNSLPSDLRALALKGLKKRAHNNLAQTTE
jgi:O-antigen/teichoic acid export membrane protein